MKLGIVEDEPIFATLYNPIKPHNPSEIKGLLLLADDATPYNPMQFFTILVNIW